MDAYEQWELDPLIKDLIIYLNEKGHKTIFSCAGFGSNYNNENHITDDGGYIMFENDTGFLERVLKTYKKDKRKKPVLKISIDPNTFKKTIRWWAEDSVGLNKIISVIKETADEERFY